MIINKNKVVEKNDEQRVVLMVPLHHNEPNQMHFCVERIENDDKSNEDVFSFHMTHTKRVQAKTMEEPNKV